MKVQQIRQSAAVQSLENWGTAAGANATQTVGISGLQKVIPGTESVDTGIFACTTGTYRRSVKQAEVMHILSGSGRFTPDGEATVHFTGGDTLFFAANTKGTWEIDEAMRKIYVIL
jgi:uncharacterized protein